MGHLSICPHLSNAALYCPALHLAGRWRHAAFDRHKELQTLVYSLELRDRQLLSGGHGSMMFHVRAFLQTDGNRGEKAGREVGAGQGQASDGWIQVEGLADG